MAEAKVRFSLKVRNRPGADEKPDYSMDLQFDLLDIKLRRDAENLARDLEEGDAKGWNSTASTRPPKRKPRSATNASDRMLSSVAMRSYPVLSGDPRLQPC